MYINFTFFTIIIYLLLGFEISSFKIFEQLYLRTLKTRVSIKSAG